MTSPSSKYLVFPQDAIISKHPNAKQYAMYLSSPMLISRAELKLYSSLKQKKFREEHQLFLAEGSKTVLEVLASTIEFHKLLATKEWIANHQSLVARLSEDKITILSVKDMGRVSSLKVTPKVAICLPFPPSLSNISEQNLLFACDGIRDPGNFGTLLRICDWYGIQDIVCSKDCVDWKNPKVIQASMGSFLRVHVHKKELAEWLDTMIDWQILIADMHGRPYYNFGDQQSSIVILGNEAQGIRLIDKKFDKISIPRIGQAESLNVSVSAALMASEFFRP